MAYFLVNNRIIYIYIAIFICHYIGIPKAWSVIMVLKNFEKCYVYEFLPERHLVEIIDSGVKRQTSSSTVCRIKCNECDNWILSGGCYYMELYKQKNSKKEKRHVTCLACLSLRNSFYKPNVIYRNYMYEDLKEYLLRNDGIVPSGNIVNLSQKAKQILMILIQELMNIEIRKDLEVDKNEYR